MVPDRRNKKGFTLVEILVVITLFSVFGMAIYSLYLTHMKTSITQEEVIDVQQNVRIAMDRLTRDIMMAGFLVPPEPLSGKTLCLDPTLTNYSSMITVRTASAESAIIRLNSSAETVAATNLVLSVTPASSLGRFKGGDGVRIIRSLNIAQPSNTVFTVITSVRNSATMTLANNTSGIDYQPGDVVCKVDSTVAPYPETVAYTVVPCNEGATTCLARSVNGGVSELIAQGISGVRFSYLLDDGTETNAPSDVNNDEKLSSLRAVRVIVNGRTSKRASPGEPLKTRQLMSIVKLRNRR